MFYTFKNCKILVNDTPFYVRAASISEENSLVPSYNINSQYSTNYLPTNGIGGTFKISYLLTGRDILTENISQENDTISVNFGGLYFNRGYLKSYSFDCEPNTPTIINAEISFFDSLSGTFSPTYENSPSLGFLNISDCQVTNVPGNYFGSITNVTKLSYDYNIGITPQYSQGQTIPNRIVLDRKEVQVNLTSDLIDGLLGVSGTNTALRIKFVHPTNSNIFQNYDCKGVLYRKDISANEGDIVNNSISIRQNDLSSFGLANQQNVPKPVIYLINPTTGFYGTIVTISGKNLSYVNLVSFNGNIFDYSFQNVNNNQIQTTVPDSALSGPITLYTSGGATSSNQSFLIGGLPITINNINPITGDFGSIINISGSNFYEISDVIFNEEQASNFKRVNKNLIQATVPNNAAWGYINIISNSFGLSGISSQKFVPIPNILGFYPSSGFTGENIVISGNGFSGITGITFNNLSGYLVSVVDNTGIIAEIPSGNTNGLIKIFGQSGVSDLSLTNFYPYARITGIYPLSGRTGDNLDVKGKNYFPEILYNLGSNQFAVGFQGNVTGYFELLSDTRLSGIVPYGAKSGVIHIYSPTQNQYPSDVVFLLKHQPPTISYFSPISGKRNDVVYVVGTDFVNIEDVIVTGFNTGQNLNGNFSVSNAEDYISFNIPQLTGGNYDVIINTSEGSATGSGMYILEVPYISGFTPLSGKIGTTITLTGLNLYGGITNIYIDGTGTGAFVNSGSFNNSYNQVQFSIPSIESGLHNIIVYNTVDYKTASVQFNATPVPYISGIYPSSGGWGDTIIVSGKYFNLIESGFIGNVSITNSSIINETEYQFSIPNYASTNFLKLYNFNGYGVSSKKLVIIPPLIGISGFQDNPTYYGSGLLISGSNLNTTKQVCFSGANGEKIITSFTTGETTGLYLTVPSNISGGYPIKLVNDRGFSYSSENLNLIPNAVIGLLSNYTGVFKDNIFISGSGLSGTLPYFQSLEGSLILGDNIDRVNDSGLYFSVPSGIVSNPISVKSRNDNLITFTGNFCVLPTISGISGNLSYSTGQYITITGINLNTDSLVKQMGISGNNGGFYNIANYNEFSGVYKTGYSLITSRINSNFAGTGKLFLISEYDSNLDFSLFTGSHSYYNKNNIVFNTDITISQPEPVIYSFNPSGGSTGTQVTISGDNLFSVENIYFNVNGDSNAGIVSYTGNNTLIVYPPLMATGTGILTITTSFGVTSTGLFRVLPKLIISGVDPVFGHTGDLIRISGAGMLSVTGVSFGSYSSIFNGINEAGTYVISGIIPETASCCGETVNIFVYNEGDSAYY